MKVLLKLAVSACLIMSIGACTTTATAPVSDRTLGPEEAPVVTGGTEATAAPVERFYVVETGDTLNRIAQKFGHTWQEVAAWNDLTDPDQISVGQTIRVSPPAGAPTAGVTVTPVAPSGPSIASTPTSTAPASKPAASAPSKPLVKSGPVARVEPYSDSAWAAAKSKPGAAPTAPAATGGASETAAPDAAPAAASSAAWIWPSSGKVLSGFGNGNTKGIDIAGKPGDDVRASAGGRVVYAGAGLRGYGKLVIIKHDADFLSAYAHNRSLNVKEGQAVTKGQKIAELGSTDADRPKLHFEIRRRGKPVDPLRFLPKR